MSTLAAASQLRNQLSNSEVLLPESPGYGAATKRWNAAIEKEAPIVVLAGSTADVAATLRIRNELDLDLAVVGGGHFTGAASVTDSGILLSLSRLNQVDIDATNRTARVQGGALTGAVARAAGEHKLAVVAGNVSKVGFAGMTLSGGYGHLTGQFGLMADNLLSAEVVLADGSVVTASPSQNPDLFWTLRGAGQMMGVVTQLTVQLHQLQNRHNLVVAGSLWYPVSRADEVLHAVNRIVPDPTGRANLLLVLAAPPPTLAPMLIASIFYDGSEDEAREFFKGLYDLKPTMVLGGGPMPSEVSGTLVDFTADLGQRQTMGSGMYVSPLEAEALRWVVEKYVGFVEANADKGVSAEVLFEFHQLDKVRAGGGTSSVYPHRGSSQNVMVCVSHLHEAEDKLANEFVNDMVTYLRNGAGVTDTANSGGVDGPSDGDVVVGTLDDGDQGIYTGYDNGRTNGHQVFGPERTKRLLELKAKYDPNNVFNKWYPLV